MRNNRERIRLVAEMQLLPSYEGWCFSYEYPGFFSYCHPGLSYCVAFTPDWEGAQELPIQVTSEEGDFFDEHSSTLPLPYEGRTAAKIFDLVKPTLDKLMKLSSKEICTAIAAVRRSADTLATEPKA